MKSFRWVFLGCYLSVGLLFWQGILACGGSPSPNNGANANTNTGPFAFQNNLFTNTVRFEAAVIAQVKGVPNFSWSALGTKHVVCAVFSQRIQTKQNRITNLGDVVWIWHTGLGKGREGNVLYEHGIPKADSTSIPEPLPPGNYYWGVWAIDDAGTPIRSTIEYTLTIQ